MKEWFLNFVLGALMLCALVTTSLVVRRELLNPRPTSGVRSVPEWRSLAMVGHRMGPPDAPVTVVVFSDFQCPYCAALAKRLRAVRQMYPTQVSVVYRHFPLASHPYAIDAARASECAAEQGRFEAFHDALFAGRDSLGVEAWERFATTAGVGNLRAFSRCVRASTAVPALARDTVAGDQLHVSGTPTLLINGTMLVGSQPLDTLEEYVSKALRGST